MRCAISKLLLLLVLLGAPAFGVVQLKTATCGNRSNAYCTGSFDTATTNGNTVFIVAAMGFSPGTIDCSDDAAQTYTKDVEQNPTGLPWIVCRKSSSASITTFKVRGSGFNSATNMVAIEVSGIIDSGGGNFYDAISTVKDNGFGTSSTWTSNSVTPNYSDYVLGVACDIRTATQNWSATGGGFSLISDTGTGTAGAGSCVVSDKSTSSAAAISGTLSLNTSSAQAQVVNIAYKAGGGPPAASCSYAISLMGVGCK